MSDNSTYSDDHCYAPDSMSDDDGCVGIHWPAGRWRPKSSAYPYGMLDLFEEDGACEYFGILSRAECIAVNIAHIALHTLSWDDKNTDCFLPLDVMNEVVGQLSEMNATEYAKYEYNPNEMFLPDYYSNLFYKNKKHIRSIAVSHAFHGLIVRPLKIYGEGSLPHEMPYVDTRAGDCLRTLLRDYTEAFDDAVAKYSDILEARLLYDRRHAGCSSYGPRFVQAMRIVHTPT